MIQECIELYQVGELTRKKGFLGLSGLVFLAVGVSLPYAYWKHSPKITVDENYIRFGNQEFYLEDIDHYDLTTKVPFRYIIAVPMEGSTITFRNGTVKTFFDDMYANSWEIKSFLHRTINKTDYIPQPITNFEQSLIESERKDVFKGNPFISFRGILLWGGIAMFIQVYSKGNYEDNSAGMLVAFLSVVLFWFFVHSWSMHYFNLTKDFLIIKNHNLLWRKRHVRLSDIEEVVIEVPEKQANTMRLITKDFKSSLYPAGTLRTQTWCDLIERLVEKGISVRNECISRKQ